MFHLLTHIWHAHIKISNFKFKYWPLNFNSPHFYDNDEDLKQRNPNNERISGFLNTQRNSLFKYTLDEIIDSEADQVISHLYGRKPMHNIVDKKFNEKYKEYARMTGLYDELKQNYPKVF